MAVDLFAGVAVRDLARATEWYDRFFADGEAFSPNDTERVWTLADQRHVYAELDPERAGHARLTIFLADADRFIEAAGRSGIEPAAREVYDNGVRKYLFRDPDGNEIGIGAPPEQT